MKNILDFAKNKEEDIILEKSVDVRLKGYSKQAPDENLFDTGTCMTVQLSLKKILTVAGITLGVFAVLGIISSWFKK